MKLVTTDRAEFRAALPEGGRLIGMDVGTKTIGLALQVKGIVIGLPLNLDGTNSPRSQASRAFAHNVADIGLPVLLWDERWSTQAVTRTLLEADASRARRDELVDKLAASYILQGAIDGLVAGLE
ncbi:MAG: Holliday junction resolvase RuvX [Sphingobium sp.]|nr:MAG: Holliday junction resolvase RuvX [Sphingobium sp.]